MGSKPLILIANDDGYYAPGITALWEAMETLGDRVICCPDREQSAQSHALTLHRPLRIQNMGQDRYAVDGTPTDAVLLGIHVILKGRKPDLVISGINAGPNLGDDISYSGTVSAALEGTIFSIPSIAVSVTSHAPESFEPAKVVARDVAAWVLKNGLPPDVTLNVNVPDLPASKIKGRRITVQGKRHFEELVAEKTDPRGQKYYWIAGTRVVPEQDPRSDILAVETGHVSLTPLRLDLTAFDGLEFIQALTTQKA